MAAALWLANFTNPNTKRAYKQDVEAFIGFAGVESAEDFRLVTAAHVIAWRDTLTASGLAAATIQRHLSALSSLFAYLCDQNAVTVNPVTGVKRPSAEANIGKTPALSDAQAKRILDAPEGDGIKAQRDRAILATYLYHGIRRSELVTLRVNSITERRGVAHFTIKGKGSKTRYIPAHPHALETIADYLDEAGHGEDPSAPLFQPVSNNTQSRDRKPITGDGVFRMLKSYASQAGIRLDALCLHSLRATAATNAIENGAPLNRVQEMLGHANISTTRMYDHSKSRPADSPIHRIRY